MTLTYWLSLAAVIVSLLSVAINIYTWHRWK